MLGAVLGDIVGSPFEYENHRSPFFSFLGEKNFFTDETVIMAAVTDILNSGKELTPDYISDELRVWMLSHSERVPGAIFIRWCYSNNNMPYNSTGNQALIRAIPIVKWAVKKGLSLNDTLALVKDFVVVTHDSFDAIKASETYATLLYRLMKEIKDPQEQEEDCKELLIAVCVGLGQVDMSETISQLRIKVVHNVNAQFALKVMLASIIESDDFEQSLKNIVSIGGDSDTLCAITGAVAEIIWGCPKKYLEAIPNYFTPLEMKLLDTIKTLY